MGIKIRVEMDVYLRPQSILNEKDIQEAIEYSLSEYWPGFIAGIEFTHTKREITE